MTDFDTVLARVVELVREGLHDAASAYIDAALEQEQAESTARTILLLDVGVDLDTLRGNAPSAAARLLRKAVVADTLARVGETPGGRDEIQPE